MKGDLDLNNFQIKNLSDPIDIKDVTNKEYVEKRIDFLDNKLTNSIDDLWKKNTFNQNNSEILRTEQISLEKNYKNDLKSLKDDLKHLQEEFDRLEKIKYSEYVLASTPQKQLRIIYINFKTKKCFVKPSSMVYKPNNPNKIIELDTRIDIQENYFFLLIRDTFVISYSFDYYQYSDDKLFPRLYDFGKLLKESLYVGSIENHIDIEYKKQKKIMHFIRLLQLFI